MNYNFYTKGSLHTNVGLIFSKCTRYNDDIFYISINSLYNMYT